MVSGFMGRIDLVDVRCSGCGGTGRDPRKKKRRCPMCDGIGWARACPKCGRLATRGNKDASGQYRTGEDEVCKCYDGILM